MPLIAPSHEKNSGFSIILCRVRANACKTSSYGILLKMSFPRQDSTTLSMGTPIPAPTRKACAAEASMIVVLVWDKPGPDDNPVAIKLRASDDFNAVRVSF